MKGKARPLAISAIAEAQASAGMAECQISDCPMRLNKGLLLAQSLSAKSNHMSMWKAFQKSTLSTRQSWKETTLSRGQGSAHRTHSMGVNESFWDVLGRGRGPTCRLKWGNPEEWCHNVGEVTCLLDYVQQWLTDHWYMNENHKFSILSLFPILQNYNISAPKQRTKSCSCYTSPPLSSPVVPSPMVMTQMRVKREFLVAADTTVRSHVHKNLCLSYCPIF